jgi:hypothetical protein
VGVEVDGGAVRALDGAQARGDAGFAGGDDLAVAPAIGACEQGLAVPLDFTGAGLAVDGVGGDGVDGHAGGGLIEEETDGPAGRVEGRLRGGIRELLGGLFEDRDDLGHGDLLRS